MLINIDILEEYSKNHPQQVLIVKAREGEEELEIMIFKGFSSNLTGETAFDSDIPLLSPSAQIISLDILHSPYNPNNPQYLHQNFTPSQFISLLSS